MKRKHKKILFLGFVFTIFILVFANYLIEKNAKNKTFDNPLQIPKNKVGLVLGTSKTLKDGRLNYYFKYRVDAAVKLYKNGKIEYILVSGDNGNKAYDEPSDFKNELIKRGIPADKIFLDYAGFRTWDSVIRAKEIFGQDSLTIISQKFHNERAIFIAEHKGIKAIGFNAKDVTAKYGIKTKVREAFARVKVFVDIIFDRKPKFLGEKIKIQ